MCWSGSRSMRPWYTAHTAAACRHCGPWSAPCVSDTMSATGANVEIVPAAETVVTCLPLGQTLADEQGWEGLRACSPAASPFAGWAWHRAWFSAAPAEELHATRTILLRGAGHAVEAILPLALRTVEFRRQRTAALTWAIGDLGCPGPTGSGPRRRDSRVDVPPVGAARSGELGARSAERNPVGARPGARRLRGSLERRLALPLPPAAGQLGRVLVFVELEPTSGPAPPRARPTPRACPDAGRLRRRPTGPGLGALGRPPQQAVGRRRCVQRPPDGSSASHVRARARRAGAALADDSGSRRCARGRVVWLRRRRHGLLLSERPGSTLGGKERRRRAHGGDDPPRHRARLPAV